MAAPLRAAGDWIFKSMLVQMRCRGARLLGVGRSMGIGESGGPYSKCIDFLEWKED